MGAARKVDIHGAKGGEEKPKTPTEAPDSLRSVAIAKILIAVGEGEFEGTPTAKDIYLDNTPLQDPQGNMNFPNVKWEWRTGAVDQSYIQGIPSVENETTISTELRSGTPWVRAITNTQLSAVRVRFAWPALQSVDAGGNINGYAIGYKVELATDGGAYQEVLNEAVSGKTTSLYERTRRIDLPKATTGWLMRITRLTTNQNNNKISDTMQIAGFTEVIDAKIRYPNTALLYIEFSAEQFRSIPAVTIETKLKKMQVPSNYDPVSRTYSGVWDGTFKQAWTDNAVWMTYDITTADRFGLGRRIKPWMVDKWELYRISQYCDQLVPDGKGGQEPRFICNLNLQSKADAWALLRDISAIYRGMTYWAQGQVFTLSDMPRATDFDFAYTRANVLDGKFTYSSASERTRYTRALISYDNPQNNYDTDVTAVTDQKLQRRYGDNPLEISAIGCTRESEAQRRGKWALLTNSKDRAVTFKVGLDGRIPLPGYVIPIADELLAGRAVGGRISEVNGRVITLDRDTQAKPGDRLILNLPDGKCEGRTVQLVSGRQITVTVAYSVVPEPELVWALDADDLAIPLYRVVSVARPEPGVFEISAVQYDPSKFAHIDTGARLEERPISVIPITVVPPPASVTLTSSYAVNQGIAISTMNISWPAVNGAVAYDVEWRKDSGNWIKVQRTGSTSVDVTGIYSGAYLARVRSVSAFEISSIWKSSNLTNLQGKVGLPPAVSFLRTTSELFGISIKWGFPAGAEDTQRTELWYGPANSLPAATKLADLAYPQAEYRMQQLKAGATLFFWARLVDRTGNIGPFYPVVNGVMGQSSSDAGPILEQIKGQIDESSLAPALNGRINLIDGNGPGSVNARNAQLRKDLEAQIKPYVDALLWDAAKGYAKGDIVRQGNKLYQALAANSGSQPPSASWKDVGDILTDANALAIRVDNLDQKITVVDGKVVATQDQLNQLQTKVNDPVTGLVATANNVTQVNQRVTNVDNKLTAQTERIDGVYAEINAPMAGSDNDLAGGTQGYAGVWSIQSAVTDGDYAQAKFTQTVEAQVNKNYATYEQTTTALVNGQTAQAAQTSVLRTDFEGNKATVNQQIAVVSDATKTNAQSIGTLRTDFNSNSSAVQTSLKTLTDSTGANATATQNLQTTVGGHTQQFQQQASINQSVDGKVSGTYSLRYKLDVNGIPYSAGIGFGIESGANGTAISRFVIQADQFAIYNGALGAAGSSVPFAVNGTETYIKSAFIQDGTITNAKIGNYIQSNNYVSGVSGWKLFFDGTFEINGVVPGQGRSMMTNRSLRFWDVNGVKRVQIGDLSE
ncbi:host specificity protein [Pseudomonas simiae]|nr:host specificity protein [Pseudomonas simiae]